MDLLRNNDRIHSLSCRYTGDQAGAWAWAEGRELAEIAEVIKTSGLLQCRRCRPLGVLPCQLVWAKTGRGWRVSCGCGELIGTFAERLDGMDWWTRHRDQKEAVRDRDQ